MEDCAVVLRTMWTLKVWRKLFGREPTIDGDEAVAISDGWVTSMGWHPERPVLCVEGFRCFVVRYRYMRKGPRFYVMVDSRSGAVLSASITGIGELPLMREGSPYRGPLS
jgi:hypothetical protein